MIDESSHRMENLVSGETFDAHKAMK